MFKVVSVRQVPGRMMCSSFEMFPSCALRATLWEYKMSKIRGTKRIAAGSYSGALSSGKPPFFSLTTAALPSLSFDSMAVQCPSGTFPTNASDFIFEFAFTGSSFAAKMID